MNTYNLKTFNSKYRLATIKDFKAGLTYFLKVDVMDELGTRPVKPTNNLVADATKFQGYVLRGEAYLPIAAKKKSTQIIS